MTLEITKKKNKLILILKSITSNYFTDEEIWELKKMGDKICPDPYWMDYIYNKKYNLTIEEAVEKAFEYKPIIL